MCTATSATSTSSSSPVKRRIVVVTAVITLLLLVLLTAVLLPSVRSNIHGFMSQRITVSPHRKLLSPKRVVDKPDRFWEDTDRCDESNELVITQKPGDPLPNGIPTYTVQIENLCLSGCDIGDIHIHCGWFSSAILIDPSLFKRIHFNDCLVNGGKPLQNGHSIYFQYANIHSYPLAVSSMSCL